MSKRWDKQWVDGSISRVSGKVWSQVYYDSTVSSLVSPGLYAVSCIVPMPPKTEKLFVQGMCNLYASGAAINVVAHLEAGTAVIATAQAQSSDPGSVNIDLVAVWRPPKVGETVGITMRLISISGATTAKSFNRGLIVSYIDGD